MAVMPRDIRVTRDDVAGWLADHKRAQNLPNFKTSRRDFLKQRIAERLPDTVVNTSGHDALNDQTELVDLVMMDLDSYG